MSAGAERVPCLDPETLAAFAEGKLRRHEIAAVLAHLDGCLPCTKALAAANDFAVREARPSARPWPFAVAAAVVIALFLAIVLAIPFLRHRTSAPGVAHLVALAPTSERTVEPRLSGGFGWAPYRGPARAAGENIDSNRLRLAGAAGDAVQAADTRPSGAAQQTAGVALLLIDQANGAAKRLRDAADRDPSNARIWNDFAAAEYNAALRLDRPSLYPEALAATDHALRLDPQLPEALFNRALVLERLGLTHQARDAWHLYLKNDSTSAWAAEAAEHLRRLPASTGTDLFRREQPQFERAVAAGDVAAATQFVDRHRQQSRTFAEAEYLGQWGEAAARDDAAEAARLLALARTTGRALSHTSGEMLLSDAVDAITAASDRQRASIAEAHRLYRRGRITYSRHEPAAAETDLRRSAGLFASASDPMSLVARYYAASARFDQGDVKTARNELETVLAETLERRGAIALAAEVRWELSLCLMVDNDWEGALTHVTAARSGFEQLGERSNVAFLDGLLADTLICLGRADEAWSKRILAFTIQSAEARGDRLAVSVDGAMRMELRTGRLDAARAFAVLEEAMNRASNNDVLLTNTLAREAILDRETGDAPAAARNAEEAMAVALRIADPTVRARAVTDAEFAEGTLLVRSDPRKSIEFLTKAIDGYRSLEMPLFLPEGYLLRARAERNGGDEAAAIADLDRGIDTLERHQVNFSGSIVGSGIFDARTSLYHDAMSVRLDRGEVAEALTYAERSRTRVIASPTAFSVAELQRRLSGSRTAVLELVTLRDEVVGFAVTDRALAMQRRGAARTSVLALEDRLAGGDDGAASELYDLLIRPHETLLASAERLIVVADTTLSDVPFAALFDKGAKQRLLEKMTVATAPDAGSLLREDGGRTPQSVVAVSLPAKSGDALTERGGELRDIATFYRRAVAIDGSRATFPALQEAAGQADVIHIAGHTEREPSGDTALVFAPADGKSEPISWRVAAAAALRPGTIVVLAACETLRMPRASQTFSLSLGDGFLAAGAADVIGTLYPIPDNEARVLFAAVHRHLAAHLGAAEAVRRAQLEALAAGGRLEAWRSLAVITRHIGV